MTTKGDHSTRSPSPQPPPTHNTGDVWHEVIDAEQQRPDGDQQLVERWERRRLAGIERYGVPLGRADGRDEWRDLLEELDDAIVYAARLNLGAEVQILRSLLLRVLARGGAR